MRSSVLALPPTDDAALRPFAAAPMIDVERVQLLYRFSLVGYLATLIVALFLGALLWEALSRPAMFGWLAFISLLTVARYLLYKAYLAGPRSPETARRWAGYFVLGSAAMGLAWSLIGTVLLPAGNELHQVTILLLVALLCTGAVVELAPSRAAFLAYVLPALIPTSVHLLLLGGKNQMILGLMLGLLAAIIVCIHRRAYQALRDALAARVLSRTLSTELSKAELQVKSSSVALRHEIAERRRAEEAERQAAQRLRLHVEHTPLAMIEWNTQFHVTAWNQAAERIFGHAKEDVLGRNALTLLVREDARETINRDWLALMLQQGGTTGHYDNVTKDGRAIVCEWSNTPLVDAGGRVVGIASLVQDITERRQTEETIRHMAHHDSLTGLANRRLLKDRLEQAIFHTRRGARHLAVVSLDLDRFKLINDTLGHAAGDGVLREIASRLCACVREGDTVSRDGGDEFVIVLSDLNQPADAERVLDKIKRELARPFSVNEHEFHVTPSIGVSFSPSDGADPELLLKHAGAALHAAKEGGRNTQRVYTAGVKSLLDQRLAIETRLRRGLERNEFLLHYQPQIELSSGRISGSESLVRWRESGQGKEMFPSEFIPIAEEMGVIAALGEWVLATACEQLKRWHELGFPHLHISVNLSPRQFLARNLLDNVKRVLVHTGVNPVNLELEITESMIMSNPERASEVLQELRAMGVQLAIDDFGTGHSSLSHLKRFPVHTLKIDPSFVRGVPHGQEDSAITQAIVAMARSLRLRVVAEGVENKVQLDYLRALGCDAVQGYLFSRPLPAAEFAALLHAEPGSLSTLLAISPSEPAPV